MARGAKKPSKLRQPPSAVAVPTQNAGDKVLQSDSAPKELQQLCLNIFRDALKPSPNDASTVQEVKGHLFNRDFASAFGNENFLRVYASRWSPSRALAYLQILVDLTTHLITERPSFRPEGRGTLRAVCLGGGAGGELIALAGLLHLLSSRGCGHAPESLHVDLIDFASWATTVQKLHARIIEPPELSIYASQAKKDANTALLGTKMLSAQFHQLDILDAEQMSTSYDFANADLITCMFTLNELYSSSMAKTQQFLATLTNNVRPGTLLLVVDSPGSYSTISLGGSEKRYPMQWMLDHTLRRSSGKVEGAGAAWQRLESHDSQWFRRARDLKYPIDLEDMRYQLHLYLRADIGLEPNHDGT